MSLRFQADANLDPDIARGLRLREPSIDFRAAHSVIPDGMPDPEVLAIAADDGRVLVSADVTTMEVHFLRFIEQHDSPGILLIHSSRSIGQAIEGLLMVWLNWSVDELRNQVRWLPRGDSQRV